MTSETLETDIKEMTDKLIQLARDHCWNEISDNCLYILSEIKDDGHENLFEQRANRIKENKLKEPKSLKEATAALLDIYHKLYDINFYVYKAQKSTTIIEIRYYPKSSLDNEFRETVLDKSPMTHCKVSMPQYADRKSDKFDVNWEFGGLRHQWKMYWWKRSLEKGMK